MATPDEGPAKRDYNIILIVMDAANANHFSSYGYPRKTTPYLDHFAEQGALFENCISQGWYTKNSFASTFTSKYLHSHNVTDSLVRLPESEVTLAEILKKNGYRTAGFVGGIFLEPIYGFAQGFDTYYSSTELLPKDKTFSLGKSAEVFPQALEWIEKNKENRFFVFIHSYDLFMPCQVPHDFVKDKKYFGIANELLSLPRLHLRQSYRKTFNLARNAMREISLLGKEVVLEDLDRSRIISNYDDGLNYSDDMHGKLLQRLDELGLAENTVVIFTSDHGSGMFEHGRLRLYILGSMYDEIVRVPLIIRTPGMTRQGSRIKGQVQLIDLMPTVLDLAGVPVPGSAEGKSLVPLLRGREQESSQDYVFSGWKRCQMVRSSKWKLLYVLGKFELYDLDSDPGELNDLSEEKPEVVLDLLGQMFRWNERALSASGINRMEIDSLMKERLKKAGYW